MKQLYLILSGFFFITAAAQKNNVAVGFMENKGQIVDQNGKPNTAVKYLLNTPGLNVQLRNTGFSYDVYEEVKQKAAEEDYPQDEKSKVKTMVLSQTYILHRIDIDFSGANKNTVLIGGQQSEDYNNYYNVPLKPEGVTKVFTFQTVTYQNLYNHIDVVFTIPDDKNKPVEYNFIVKPGGNINDIRMVFNGADTNLVRNSIFIKTRFGKIQETLPESWIEDENGKELLHVSYVHIKKNIYGFHTEHATGGKTIVIDPAPVRLWGTYFTSDAWDLSNIETDAEGKIYLAGSTSDNTHIATSGSFMVTMTGYSDGYIVKFNPDGSRIWGTYYGGEHFDRINGMKIYDNEIFLGGVTRSSTNIATPGSFKETLTPGGFSVSDCFMAKFTTDGDRIWATYYGGEHDDTLYNLDVDTSGNFIITGSTYSINGISTPGSFKEVREQPVNPNILGEGFIAKFNGSGQRLWGTYYNLCYIWGLGIDSNSDIYFSGDVGWSAAEDNFTTAGTHQPEFQHNTDTGVANYETFLVKFSPNGQRIWGTLYGNAWEYNFGLAIDHNNDIYLSGKTYSQVLIATPNAHQINLNENMQTPSDGYLAKFNPQGGLLWGTYYGGDDSDAITSVDIDEGNNVLMCGDTASSNGISTTNTYDFDSHWYETFIAKFDSQGTRTWGTYFGGLSGDFASNLQYDKLGIFYINGKTYSPDNIATAGSIYPNLTGNNGCMFIEKFKDCISGAFATSNSPICVGNDLNLTANGGSGYSWTGPNGFISSDQNPVIHNASSVNSGTYSCAITGGDCDNTSSIAVLVGDTMAPVPNNALLPNISGTCNIHLSVIPTATDTCAGTITATTTDPLIYSTPGNYTVTWHYNDGHGNITTQNQQVTLTVNNTTINPQVSYSQCDDDADGKLIFDLTHITPSIAPVSSHTFSFYNTANEAETQTNPITDPVHFENTTNPHTVYVHVKNTPSGCTYTSQIDLSVVALPIVFPVTLYGCDADGDGFALFDIGDADNGIIANDPNQATLFTYHLSLDDVTIDNRINNFPAFENTSNPQVIYIKATNVNTNCYNTAAVTLVPIDIPPPPLAVDQVFCEGQNVALHNIVIAGSNIRWYTDMFSPTPLNINTALQNNSTYYASQTLNGGCESNRIPVSITLSPVPLPPYFTQSQRFCEDMHATIGDVYGIIGENIRFYDYDGNQLPLTTPLINNGSYRYTQTVNGCESLQGDAFHVTIVPLSPAPPTQANQSFCITLNPTLSNIAVNGVGIRFYDSAIGGNALPEAQPLMNGQTYYLSQTIECESHERTAVTIALTDDFTVNNLTPSICDASNDDYETADLSGYQPALINTAAAYNYVYYTSLTAAENQSVSNKIDDPIHYPVADNTTIFVRISFAGCYQIAQLNFTLLQSPVIPLQDTIPICNNKNITLDAGAGFSSYHWSSGEHGRYVTFFHPGNYSVTVTKNYGAISCSATKNITVVASDIASITHIGTTDWTQNINTITIDATGPGDYEYSVDGINFQDANNFTGLQNGLYTAYVRDKNGCGTVTDEVWLLMYPNFFTPNGDGLNDTWNIKFSVLEPGLEIKIFDRYGKFLKQILRNGMGWDGTYNGHELPSTDYWFVVTRGNGKEYKGHFSLKR